MVCVSEECETAGLGQRVKDRSLGTLDFWLGGDEMRRRMWEGCGLCVLMGFSSEPSRQEAGYVGRCLD